MVYGITTVAFFTHQICTWVKGNYKVKIGQEEADSHDKHVSELKKEDWAKLWDEQISEEILSPKTDIWKCKQILSHKVDNGRTLLLCEWDDGCGSRTWVPLNSMILHQIKPVLVYAIKHGLLKDEPFRKLKEAIEFDVAKRYKIIMQVKAQQRNGPKHKFGVEVPRSLAHALTLDKANGNNLWMEAAKKEITQLLDYKTFIILDEGEKPPEGYQRIPHHIVFDVKFDLRRKGRLVAGGNWTEVTGEDIYSGVIGSEFICYGFFLGELFGLTVCAGDIGNAFLYGKTKEKVYIIAGPEFGKELQGRVLIVDKALYGLRTSCARFHEHCSDTLRKLGFVPSKADSDLWMRKKDDHYELIACYVDDLLVWSKDPMKIMKKLQETYVMKGIGIPEYFLGGNIERTDEHWSKHGINISLSASTYIKNMIPKFESLLGVSLGKKITTPMAEGYHPELEESDLLNAEEASKFRSIIGSLNWIITLGRFDIAYATSALSRYGMNPRKGHMIAAHRILRYLNCFPNGKLIIDTQEYVDNGLKMGEDQDWTELYPDAAEELPDDAPESTGKRVFVWAYVDADHAHDQVTRRSITGIIVFVNSTPIKYVCKRQGTVESSTYGSEMVAARIATEIIMEVQYNMRMLGVEVVGPSRLIGDNMSVILSTSIPSSMLKKKHQSICYHKVREACAAGIIKFYYIDSKGNIADILTKPLGGEMFWNIVKKWLFCNPPDLEKEKNKLVDIKGKENKEEEIGEKEGKMD